MPKPEGNSSGKSFFRPAGSLDDHPEPSRKENSKSAAPRAAVPKTAKTPETGGKSRLIGKGVAGIERIEGRRTASSGPAPAARDDKTVNLRDRTMPVRGKEAPAARPAAVAAPRLDSPAAPRLEPPAPSFSDDRTVAMGYSPQPGPRPANPPIREKAPAPGSYSEASYDDTMLMTQTEAMRTYPSAGARPLAKPHRPPAGAKPEAEEDFPRGERPVSWWILGACVLLPIVGLILWLAWKDSEPKRAYYAGKWGLIGLLAWIALAALLVILIIITGANLMNQADRVHYPR